MPISGTLRYTIIVVYLLGPGKTYEVPTYSLNSEFEFSEILDEKHISEKSELVSISEKSDYWYQKEEKRNKSEKMSFRTEL